VLIQRREKEVAGMIAFITPNCSQFAAGFEYFGI
jgi:hypothetical protein